MTIIQPNRAKTKTQTKFIFGSSIGILVAFSAFGVFMYTRTVDLRHDVAKLEGTFSKLQAENADLKNQMYSLLSPEYLTEVGRDLGLSLEKRPKYLETPVDTLATQFDIR